MVDPDFEKQKVQDLLIKNPIDQFKKSNYFKNEIDEQTKCFEKLTKIAGKPEINVEFEPFVSPMLKIDLSIYKKRKRKQLYRESLKKIKTKMTGEKDNDASSLSFENIDNDDDESIDSSDIE